MHRVWQIRDHLPAGRLHKLVFNLVQCSQAGELLVAGFSHLSSVHWNFSLLWQWLGTSSRGYFGVRCAQ